jgi:hypothetical protein
LFGSLFGLIAGILESVLANDAEPVFPYLSSKEACTSLLGGTNVSIIFTADPGLQYGGIGENYYLRQRLKDGKNVTFSACFSVQQSGLDNHRRGVIDC